MAKLTTMQMLVLAAACEQDDGIATRPNTLNRSAAVKVAAKLLEHGLVQERRAKQGWPVWRVDADGKSFSLKILKQGRAIVSDPSGQVITAAPRAAKAVGSGASRTAVVSVDAERAAPPDQPKSGSKRTVILALMQRAGGATIADLTAATGWLPHTARAALTGLRKSGTDIVRSRDAQASSSIYRIEPADTIAAA